MEHKWETVFSFNIETPNGIKHVFCMLLPQAFANQNLYNRLLAEIDTDLKHIMIKIPFKGFGPTRRRIGSFSTSDLRYSYSGTNEEAVPMSKSPILSMINNLVGQSLGKNFNFALINHYADGTDDLGFHADKESDLIPGYPIASVSLGTTRDFMIRVRQDKFFIERTTPEIRNGISSILAKSKYVNPRCKKEITLSIPLNDGDLLVMGGDMQGWLEHSVPKRETVKTGRINITLRGVQNS